MRTVRPVTAVDPRLFGRRSVPARQHQFRPALSKDARLFATTYAAGFLFMFLFIA